jgi:hypothetical protein
MDDRDRIANQRLIESSQQTCRNARALVARARDATRRARADLERMREMKTIQRIRIPFWSSLRFCLPSALVSAGAGAS